MKLHALLAVALVAVVPSLAKAKDGIKVNLQWSICDADAQVVLQKLGEFGRDPHKQNPITYYDTKPPVYTEDGLMFRTKTNKHQELSTLKVRFARETSNVPDTVSCIWDRYGEWMSYTCEMRCPLDGTSLWCDDQVRFAEQYWSVGWKELVAFGPYMNAKWRLKIEGYKAVFDDVAAQSHHLMEMEVKVPISEGADAYRTVTEYLIKRGIVLCDRQEPKTLRLFRTMGYPVKDGESQSLEQGWKIEEVDLVVPDVKLGTHDQQVLG